MKKIMFIFLSCFPTSLIPVEPISVAIYAACFLSGAICSRLGIRSENKTLQSTSITIGDIKGNCNLTPTSAYPPIPQQTQPPISPEIPKLSKSYTMPSLSFTSLSEVPHHLIEYVKNNKISVAAKAAACAYLYSNIQLLRWSAPLYHPHCWSVWKAEYSLADLIAIPRNVLGEQLIAEFSGRYQKIGHESLTIAITKFLQDIDHEYMLLEKYKSLGNKLLFLANSQDYIIRSCNNLLFQRISWAGQGGMLLMNCIPSCTAFFALNRGLLASCQERQTRLNYLRETFMDYVIHRQHSKIASVFFF